MITTGIVLGSVGWGIVAVYPIKEMQKVAITGAEGGHHLVNQAVDARDNAGHVSSGAVCLIVHHICQHRGGGGADHDLQSVLQHRQNDKEDQQGGRGNNRGRSGEKQNNHKGKVYIDTDLAPEWQRPWALPCFPVYFPPNTEKIKAGKIATIFIIAPIRTLPMIIP